MSRFHQRTLALLDNEGVPQARSIDILNDWAGKNAISIPAAFTEWAKIDDGTLLRKYSNDDWFAFDEPQLVVTPDGAKGLRFHSENQNNYDRIVLLDRGDDPPVLFAWLGRPPWVTNAERFSDAVLAQVFDWQYWLEFKSDDPNYKEITYTGHIECKTDRSIQILRERYEELATTRFVVENDHYTEFRFLKSPTLRVTVEVATDRSVQVRITGRPIELVRAFEAELKLEF